MTTLPISADGQAIALACSSLALMGDRSIKPLTPTEWHGLSLSMQERKLRPRDLLGLGAGEAREALEISDQAAKRLSDLLSRGGQLALEVERLSNRGIWIVTRADEAYPPLLKRRLHRTAPPLLFGAGPRGGLQLPGIAIVGSRDVDDDGLSFATALARRCAEQSFAVISGAARGVDLTAMGAAVVSGGHAVGITVDPLEKLVGRGELRTAIADELLTLATPFHPAARWHAGNAMRRNRLIYTLAQAAVVVASSAEKGGTRAGALENLKARWVPLHVRDDSSAGNQRLIADGGVAIPGDELPSEIDLESLTVDRQHSLLETDNPAPPSPTEPAPQPIEDAFVPIWPLLAQLLQRPVGEREVAESLHLELTQARAWLKRAVAEGHAETRPRPKRYLLRGAAQQLPIDDS